jgi:hypothetical protein
MMNKTQLLSTQIKFFNEQVEKDLTDEQIADVADYFHNQHKDLRCGLTKLVIRSNKHNYRYTNSHLGICNELHNLGCYIEIYPIIGMLSYYFYSEFEHINCLYVGSKRVYHPIPSKIPYKYVDNQWTGVLLTRRLAYIDWLMRQFNLMIKHLESYQTT